MPEDTKLQHIPQPSEAAKLPQLPPLSIDTMTQVELQDFIPQLVTIMMSNKVGLHRKNSRPDWWPLHLPWAGTKTDLLYQQSNWSEPLRDAIKKCYRHMGQERLLQVNRCDSKQTTLHGNSQDRSEPSPSYYPGPTPHNHSKRPCQFAEIYICYFCEHEFSDRTQMREHQALCQERPPQLQEAMKIPPQTSDSTQGPPQMSPIKLSLSCKTPRGPKDGFIKMFNLVPKQKADKILARHRNSLDVECEELDYSVPDTPISPTTPRTPKSLISQLSREEGPASRKRLSYSQPGDNEDRESVVSGCSEDAEEKATQRGKSLLAIDISSLLGQRIQKHVKADSFIQVIGDSESFCKTPVKNSFYEKLRNRTITFPLSYKPRRKHDGKFVHKYGFTSKQKKEIKKRLKSGLSKESREILRSLPKCTVDVARLTKRELKRYLSKHSYRKLLNIKPTTSVSDSEFPKEPLLLSQNVDKLLGLKKRSELNKTKLNQLAPVNVVSEDANAEITKHKLTLYRCLLSDLAAVQSNLKKNKTTTAIQQCLTLKLKQMPADANVTVKKEKKENPPVKSSTPLLQPPWGNQDQKLKKRQSGSRSVDNISIISISSDEESVNSRCCVACRKKKLCSGDLSLMPCSSSTTPPLSVSPTSSVSVTPQVSPCSCISSPESEKSLGLNLSPSPELVQWHVKSRTFQATTGKPSSKPSLKSAIETPVSASVFQKTRHREVNSPRKQDISASPKTPVKKSLSVSKLRTSPRKSSQQQPSLLSQGSGQSLTKEKNKSIQKEAGSEKSKIGAKAAVSTKTSTEKLTPGTKQTMSSKTSPRKSPMKKMDSGHEMIIKTRSRAGLPLKRSKRIMSSSAQSSPKKPRTESK